MFQGTRHFAPATPSHETGDYTATAVPVGAQVASALHGAQDLIVEVHRLLDRLFGPSSRDQAEANDLREMPQPSGLFPQLVSDSCTVNRMSGELRVRIERLHKELGNG